MVFLPNRKEHFKEKKQIFVWYYIVKYSSLVVLWQMIYRERQNYIFLEDIRDRKLDAQRNREVMK